MELFIRYAPWLILVVITGAVFLRSASHRTNVVVLVSLIATGAAGLAINGWTVADEILLGAILCSSACSRKLPVPRIGTAGAPQPMARSGGRVHYIIFVTFCLYLSFQAVRGMLELLVGEGAGSLADSLRKIRWPIFYLMLVWLSDIARRPQAQTPKATDWPAAIAQVGSVYMVAFIMTGVVAEWMLGIDRYSLQPGMAAYSGENLVGFALFGSTAYAMFPAIVTAPAGLLLLGSHVRSRQRLGVVALTSVLGAAIYYEVRVGIFLLAAIVLAAVPGALRFKPRRAIISLTVCVLVLVTSFGLAQERTQWFIADLLSSGGAIWAESSSPHWHRDLDRVTHFQAGVLAVSKEWHTFLFGHGYRLSGSVVGSYYYDLYTMKREARPWNLDNFGTEAFSALLVDSGWVGVTLLMLCMLGAMREIRIRVPKRDRGILLMALATAAAWMLIINMLDIVLFYLLIMPGGLLVRLGEQHVCATGRKDGRIRGPRDARSHVMSSGKTP